MGWDGMGWEGEGCIVSWVLYEYRDVKKRERKNGIWKSTTPPTQRL